jgi:hypothetical protein
LISKGNGAAGVWLVRSTGSESVLLLGFQIGSVRGDHLPASLSFHPQIRGSVSAIDIVASSLDSDDETVARDSRRREPAP